MAIEEMFTSLPTVSNSTLNDIICAVQGYVNPSNLGLSTQQTLQQVYNLFQQNIILNYAGNPNGNVAGTTYQLLWDTVDSVLWVCTTSGTATSAVWQECYSPRSNWIIANTNPITILPAAKYIVSNGASLTTFTLPATALVGTEFEICGMSSGGWTIAQNLGQSINFGNLATTSGTGGSLSSTNKNDFVHVVCVTANTTWTVIGSIGNLTVV